MKRLLITVFGAMFLMLNSYSQDGPGIFKKNCAVCHTVGNGKLVGPDLKGVDKKYDIKWITQWVKSSQALVKKNDPKALQVFNDNNKMVMPDQSLSEDEIKTIVAFIGDETIKLEQAAAAPKTNPEPVAVVSPSLPQAAPGVSTGIQSKTIIYTLLGIIAFLTVALIGLSKVIKDLTEAYK
jgi:cytochrome c551/c552